MLLIGKPRLMCSSVSAILDDSGGVGARLGASFRSLSHISATMYGDLSLSSSNALGHDFRFLVLLPSFDEDFAAGKDFRDCLPDSALTAVTTVLTGLSQYMGRLAVAPLESLI